MKDAIYFDSFGVEHIPKVKKIKNKKVTRIKKKTQKQTYLEYKQIVKQCLEFLHLIFLFYAFS